MIFSATDVGTKILHFLIPPRCAFCAALPATGIVCSSCAQGLSLAFSSDPQVNYLPGTAIQVISGAKFAPPVSDALKAFKFSGNIVAGRELAALWLHEFRLPMHDSLPALWLPVPIPASRRFQRGFNQSELLARSLARKFGGSVPAGLLQTAFFRPAMARLRREQRLSTHHKFRLTRRGQDLLRSGQFSVWLVDDVYTTGTTLRRLAETVLTCNPRLAIAAVTLAAA